MAKVAFVLESFPQLSETFVLDQMRALYSDGHKIHVIADHFNELDEEIFGDLSFVASLKNRWVVQSSIFAFLGFLPWFISSRLKVFFDLISDSQLRKYDLLVAHFGLNGARLAKSRSLRRFRTPIICIFHGYDVGIPLFEGKLHHYRCLFKKAKLLLCVNEWFCEVLENAGASSAKLKVHRMGVNIDSIEYRKRERNRLDILSVCRLVEKKGINVALKALSVLIEKRPDISVNFKIVGDGPLKRELEQQAHELKIINYVEFLGAMPNATVRDFLYEANVFILPSVTATNGDVEGVPVSLMEAMASGATVVSTRHSGIPELIADGVSGFLADEFDEEGLVDALEKLHDEPELASSMALRGRLKVEADFNSENLRKSFLNYVNGCLM
ncbi:glycosyltransferase [Alcanivorax sp.]|uniref:glycosyltransferase n=1 Tax=Alcanivorax sp. TaxID=1872427 RepID=UPI0025BE5E8E|nr:glycosyltransferase [Alcanivorax sp.]